MKLKSLSRLRSELRKVTAVLGLARSPLLESLLAPSPEQLSPLQVGQGGSLEPALAMLTLLTSGLSEAQQRLVVSLSEAQQQPRVWLLQTSGQEEAQKINWLTALVLQLGLTSSSSSSGQRVLLLSPSLDFLDEITLKLVSAQSELPPSLRLRLLRFGPSSASAHPEVRKVSLESSVAALREADPRLEREALERRVVGEADVVLSCLSSPLERCLPPVSVCILDRADTCPEPESLLPLQLGVSKLVLLGSEDTTGPLAVSSQTARDLNYGQSLFSRLASVSPPLRIDREGELLQ